MPPKPSSTPPSKPYPKKTPASDESKSAPELIDARIAALDDWRGELLSRLRQIVRGVDPEIVEEWKWNIPVWSCSGIICTGETYKKAVKLTFPKGAALDDRHELFNSSLEGKVRRAIDFPEGGEVDEAGLRALVRAAIALNRSSPSRQ